LRYNFEETPGEVNAQLDKEVKKGYLPGILLEKEL